MRRYDIIFGILLSIINFALAAPILAQKNRQTYVDVPRDVVIVLEKRAPGDELEKLAEYFKKLGDSGPHASPSLLPSEHEQSMSDAPASSSSQPGLEHGQENDEHGSGPAPELLLEPSNPFSTEPPTYTPVSTVHSSYASTEYGSDHESTGTHPSQPEPYPPEWDHWLNPVDHADQEELEHVYPQPQQNGFAHGSDAQNPSPLNWHQNGFAHGNQMDGVVSTDPPSRNPTLTEYSPDGESTSTYTSQSDSDSLPPEYYWLHPWELGLEDVHVHQLNPLQPHGNEMAHGIQLNDVVSTDPSSYTPELNQEHPEYHWNEGYTHQLSPPAPQENDVVHGTQVDNAQWPPLPQGGDVAHGTQVGDGTHWRVGDGTHWQVGDGTHWQVGDGTHLHVGDGQSPQENGVTHETQVDDGKQPNPGSLI